MTKVLFVYGFGGSPESTFCTLIKAALPAGRYQVLCPEYPQEDIPEARRFLAEFARKENIDLIVGTSLGAFISLSLPVSLPCIAINPCMMPSVELPLLKKRPDHPDDKEATPEMIEACKALEEGVNQGMFNHSQRVIGLFAKEDKVLKNNYRKGFKNYYDNVRDIPGGHHGNKEAIPDICQAIEDIMKPILYIDMDNVLADFRGYSDSLSDEFKAAHKELDEVPGIFAKFPVYPGAQKALKTLKEKYDLYILSTSPWNNPTALQDKQDWLKKNFGDLFKKHVIFTHQKNFCNRPDAWLIDDRPNHGAHLFGHRWLSFGPNGKYKNWDEVTDYLMHTRFDGSDMETFCENHGFSFHANGTGKWGAYPYYTFENVHCSIKYIPFSNTMKIETRMGTFEGKMKSVEDLLSMLDSMHIPAATVYSKEVSAKNAADKQQRKMDILNRIASQIEIKYHYYPMKAQHMAMQGEWWDTTNHLSQLSLRNVDAFTAQVFEGIESGEII